MNYANELRGLSCLVRTFANETSVATYDKESAEAPLRPILRERELLLPPTFDSAHARAAAAHAYAHWSYSTPHRPAQGLKPMSIAIMSAVEDARVERLLMRRYPGVRRWFVPLLREALRPELSFLAFVSRLNLALIDETYVDGNHWVEKARELFDAHAPEDYAGLRAAASVLANDLGQMRVRFLPHEYAVPVAYRDDNSYLWHFEEETSAQQSVNLQAAADSSPTETTPQAGEASHEEAIRHCYPEWHHRLGLYRENWCSVVEKKPWPARNPPSPTHIYMCVPPVPSPRLSRARRLRRQWEGETLDLDAAIAASVDRHMRVTPDPRVFRRPGRETIASDTLLLIDLSASTNDRLPSGETILEAQKRAALLLAQTAACAGHRFAVHGFCSNGRHDIGYYRMLDFDERIDAQALERTLPEHGRYSTRLGAALRHATAWLRRMDASRPRIVLLTDGESSDIDVHETGYLEHDTRKAIAEARCRGVPCMGLSLNRKHESQMRALFGVHAYALASHPSKPSTLAALYGRLLHA